MICSEHQKLIGEAAHLAPEEGAPQISMTQLDAFLARDINLQEPEVETNLQPAIKQEELSVETNLPPALAY